MLFEISSRSYDGMMMAAWHFTAFAKVRVLVLMAATAQLLNALRAALQSQINRPSPS